jgi:hypothetical protein
MNTYIDFYEYLKASTGVATADLLSNPFRFAVPQSSGNNRFIVPTTAITTALNPYDSLYVFDGSQSEIVQVSQLTTPGTTTIMLVNAAQFSHSAGVAVCADGPGGSLADRIITASDDLETYCRQPLLQASYSSERLPLRTTLAAVTRDYALKIRPKQFPVQSIGGMTLLLDNATVDLDISKAVIDANQRLITLTQMTAASSSETTFWGNVSPPAYPTTPGFVEITYTAGFDYATLPRAIKQACIWLTSELLSDRMNPTGSSIMRLGNMQLTTRITGDKSPQFTSKAHERLEPYRQRAF